MDVQTRVCRLATKETNLLDEIFLKVGREVVLFTENDNTTL
jgi:hypothetical protein